MKKLVILFLVFNVSAALASPQTSEERLAIEVAKLTLINAKLGEAYDKAMDKIKELEAKKDIAKSEGVNPKDIKIIPLPENNIHE